MDFGDVRVVRVESSGSRSATWRISACSSEHRFSFSRGWKACGVSRHRMWRLKTLQMYVYFHWFSKTVIEELKEEITAYQWMKTTREKLRWKPTRSDTRGKTPVTSRYFRSSSKTGLTNSLALTTFRFSVRVRVTKIVIILRLWLIHMGSCCDKLPIILAYAFLN